MGDRSNRKWWRRDYLAATASVGISGLAGCNRTESPTTSNGNETTTDSVSTPGGDNESEATSGEQDGQQSQLAVRESSIGTDQVVIGTDLTVTAIIENVGTEPTTFDVKLTVVDKHKEVSVDLDPGERADIAGSVAPMTVGTGYILLNETQLGTVEVVPVASETDRTVGAHYFSWYGRPPHTWQDGKWSRESPYTPVLGNYDARDSEVIEQHIDWCHYAGVQWLDAIWTGPGSPVDKNLKNHILPHPRADELDWSLFYDTLIIHDTYGGSSVDLGDKETAGALKEHIAYLAEEYFGREYYKTIDGRPVLTTWLGSAYTGDPVSVFSEAFDEAGVDPYFIVGIGPQSIDAVELTELADAITTYNPYRPREDIAEVFLTEMESMYRSWYLEGQKTGHDIIPTVIPGFNDSEITHVERDNPILELSTDRYRNACEVGHKYAEGPIFVTAFNEWYESTFIEPSEEFGTEFLEITADTLAVDDWTDPVSEGVMVTLSFEEVVPATEIAPGTDDPRDLTMRVYGLSVYNNGKKIREVNVGGSENGIEFVQGYFPPESEPNGETARWLGGQTNSILFFEGLTEIDRVDITGWAGARMEVNATVAGKSLGGTEITTQHDTYTIE